MHELQFEDSVWASTKCMSAVHYARCCDGLSELDDTQEVSRNTATIGRIVGGAGKNVRTRLYRPLGIGILFFCSVVLAAQSYQDLFSEAAALSARGDYQSAIARYEAALRIRPDAPEALSNLGVMYHAAGRYADAVDVMQRAVYLQPALVPANLILGLGLIQLNRPADAIAPLELALAGNPKQRDAVLGLAGARVALQDLPSAILLYRRQTESDSLDSDAWYGLAVCYERMAEAASRRISQMEGGAIYHKRLLADYLLQRGEDRLALDALDEVGAGSRENKEAASQALVLYVDARRLADLSRQAFLQFVKLSPESWQSRLFLGDLYRQQRKFPESIANYEAASKLQPQSPAPLLGLGTVFWELGDNDKAERYLQQTLRLNPLNSQAIYELGDIALRQRRDEEAIKYLERYLAIQPEQMMARANLGKAYLHLNRFAEAAIQLEKALAVDRSGDIHFQLAAALRRLGRKKEADAALAESTRIREREHRREQKLRLGR